MLDRQLLLRTTGATTTLRPFISWTCLCTCSFPFDSPLYSPLPSPSLAVPLMSAALGLASDCSRGVADENTDKDAGEDAEKDAGENAESERRLCVYYVCRLGVRRP